MKSSERHHLKQNVLIASLAGARDYVEGHTRQLAGLLIVAVLVVVVVIGVVVMRQRTAALGEDLLAQAMVALNAPVIPTSATDTANLPAAAQFGATGTFTTEEAKLTAALPKLKAAADAYPDSLAGITARYHLASAYAALGQSDEALREFDAVIARAGGNSLYGQMASLGKADTQLQANQVDAAITSWKQLAEQADGPLPQDAILMELGRAYLQKGDKAEAKKTYTMLVDQHPDSPYTTEARQQLSQL